MDSFKSFSLYDKCCYREKSSAGISKRYGNQSNVSFQLNVHFLSHPNPWGSEQCHNRFPAAYSHWLSCTPQLHSDFSGIKLHQDSKLKHNVGCCVGFHHWEENNWTYDEWSDASLLHFAHDEAAIAPSPAAQQKRRKSRCAAATGLLQFVYCYIVYHHSFLQTSQPVE